MSDTQPTQRKLTPAQEAGRQTLLWLQIRDKAALDCLLGRNPEGIATPEPDAEKTPSNRPVQLTLEEMLERVAALGSEIFLTPGAEGTHRRFTTGSIMSEPPPRFVNSDLAFFDSLKLSPPVGDKKSEVRNMTELSIQAIKRRGGHVDLWSLRSALMREARKAPNGSKNTALFPGSRKTRKKAAYQIAATALRP